MGGREYVKGSITRLRKRQHVRGGPNHPTDWPTKEDDSRKMILDPQERFLQRWNRTFVLSCVVAVSLDPLFFYVPVVDASKSCFSVDRNLEIIACVLRSFNDVFYLVHIIFQFRTGFIAPPSRVFGRGELIKDPSLIRRRYLFSYFLIDVLSILPIPQAVLLLHLNPLKLKGPVPLITKEWLKYVIFCQYVPRIFRILPLWKQVTSAAGMFTETAWAGAAFNLLLYMLASHLVGAFWYMFSIERQDQCWREACQRDRKCDYRYLYCGLGRPQNDTLLRNHLNNFCRHTEPNDTKRFFNFGIFLDALQSRVAEADSKDFPSKFFYCFWWGLRNLSSLGQNLKTSTFVGENIFAIFISVFGLVLFSSLIGNMQKYLQSTNVRLEEMRVRRQDMEQWMSHRMLPGTLRERIRRYEQYKWQETRGVVEETLIRNLPKDLRRDIKHHLCLKLLMRVPMFKKMDEGVLDAVCDHLRPVLYTQRSFILREGDPVDEMLFVMRGNLQTSTTNGGRTGFFNSVRLKAGDFCGEELLTWALMDPHSTSLPTSTRTVQAISQVEAFALMADDLKLVASQFRRLHSKQLRHAFRFYSQQWRTWAASFIQLAWRRYFKKKLDRSLREAEEVLKDAVARGGGVASASCLGATIYASKFAANAVRTLQRHRGLTARLPRRSLSLLPPKPPKPDFTAEE